MGILERALHDGALRVHPRRLLLEVRLLLFQAFRLGAAPLESRLRRGSRLGRFSNLRGDVHRRLFDVLRSLRQRELARGHLVAAALDLRLELRVRLFVLVLDPLALPPGLLSLAGLLGELLDGGLGPGGFLLRGVAHALGVLALRAHSRLPLLERLLAVLAALGSLLERFLLPSLLRILRRLHRRGSPVQLRLPLRSLAKHRVGVLDVLLRASHRVLDRLLPSPELSLLILQLVALVPKLLPRVPALRLKVRDASAARVLEVRRLSSLLALLLRQCGLRRGTLPLPRFFFGVELLSKLGALSLVRRAPLRSLPLQPRRLPVQLLQPHDGGLVLALLRVDSHRPLARLAFEIRLGSLSHRLGVAQIRLLRPGEAPDVLQLVRDIPLLAIVRLERVLAPPELLLLDDERASDLLDGVDETFSFRRGSIRRRLGFPRASHHVLHSRLRLHLPPRQLPQYLSPSFLERLEVLLDGVALRGQGFERVFRLLVASLRVRRHPLGELELVRHGILRLPRGVLRGHRGVRARLEFGLGALDVSQAPLFGS